MLQEKDSRRLLDQVKDDSSSLVCLNDSNSHLSSRTRTTERSSLWNRVFDFDHGLLGTKVYQKQLRSLLKHAFNKRATSGRSPRAAANYFGSQSDIDSVAIELCSDEPKRQTRFRLDGQRLVSVLGPDEPGKVLLLDSLQKYQDPVQFSKRRALYKSKIITRTCQEFQGILKDLQANINLLDFNDIKDEARLILEHTEFFESAVIPAQCLQAIHMLSQHDIVKQHLHYRQSRQDGSNMN